MTARTHQISVGHVSRNLPIIQVEGGAHLALFDMTEDPVLIQEAATLLAAQIPEGAEVLVTVEGKSVPLVTVMAIMLCLPMVVFRKKSKYLDPNTLDSVTYTSITTGTKQTLYTDSGHTQKLRGLDAVFVDDVVSTGETRDAAMVLMDRAGAINAGTMAIFTEGTERPVVISLGHLPVTRD